MKHLSKFAILLLITLLSSVGCAKDEIYTGFFSETAASGYDVVSYFDTKTGPKEGREKFSVTWKKAEWYFISAANLKAFKKSPEKYAPQYGGYCSYAVAHDYTASSDPEAWTIVKGKLYLNYSKEVRADWLKKRDQYISQANKNWPGVLK